MATKKKRVSGAERYLAVGEQLAAQLPHLFSVLSEEDDFIELRIKAKPDGSTLALLKRFGSDGGPVICFGVGYGAVGSLMAINATVASGNWREDKPWAKRQT